MIGKFIKYYLPTLIMLLVWGCGNAEPKNHKLNTEKNELIPALDEELHEVEKFKHPERHEADPTPCTATALDFFKLQDKIFQEAFFASLDSIRQVQYPENDQEIFIMIDLTPEYLHQFLADINPDSLKLNKMHEQEYHFNIAPPQYTDSPVCKDKIAITFNEEYCRFRMEIFNTFLIKPNWCTESMVVYAFDISENGITNFWRTEAG